MNISIYSTVLLQLNILTFWFYSFLGEKMNSFNDRVIKKSYHIRRKPGSIESWFYNTIPIDKKNGMGRYSGDPREKSNARIKDIL